MVMGSGDGFRRLEDSAIERLSERLAAIDVKHRLTDLGTEIKLY
jgi:hypothetical protein